MKTKTLVVRVARSVLDVAASMQRRETIAVYGPSGTCTVGVVNKIEAESGSGYDFNIYFTDGSRVYIRF